MDCSRPAPDVCFAVLPLGSADDYAYSLRHDRNGVSDALAPGRPSTSA